MRMAGDTVALALARGLEAGREARAAAAAAVTATEANADVATTTERCHAWHAGWQRMIDRKEGQGFNFNDYGL